MLQDIKQLIWTTSGKNLDLVTQARQGIQLDETTLAYWEATLRQLQELMKPRKIKRTRKQPLTDDRQQRYIKAYHDYQARSFPAWVKDGHTLDPRPVDTGTANGLTNFIVNYINWTGGNATRVSSEGKAIVKQGEVIRIPSTTRNGSADVTSTIQGRSVKWEVKVGRDKPSPAQIKEQQRERSAGGEYFFTHDVGEFFMQYDSLVQVKTLF